MKLLGTPGSPYVRKVRLVLEEKHLPYEYVLAPASQRETMVVPLNPLGKIPVLVCDDGRTVYDSPVIVEYLDGLVAQPRLIPEAFNERIEVKRWEALGDGIAEATVLISHDYRKSEAKRESAAWYEKQRMKIQRGLAAMVKDLGERTFCHGESFTLADIAAGFALGYLDQALSEFDWRTPYPSLSQLAARLAVRDSFRETLPAQTLT